MASVTRISKSFIRVNGVSYGFWKYSRIVPVDSIVYINVFNRSIDIHYKHKKSHDSLFFTSDAARNLAIAEFEPEDEKRDVPMVKDYPFWE